MSELQDHQNPPPSLKRIWLANLAGLAMGLLVAFGLWFWEPIVSVVFLIFALLVTPATLSRDLRLFYGAPIAASRDKVSENATGVPTRLIVLNGVLTLGLALVFAIGFLGTPIIGTLARVLVIGGGYVALTYFVPHLLLMPILRLLLALIEFVLGIVALVMAGTSTGEKRQARYHRLYVVEQKIMDVVLPPAASPSTPNEPTQS